MVDEQFSLSILRHYFETGDDIISSKSYSFSPDGLLNIYMPLRRRWGRPMPDGMWPLSFGTIDGSLDMPNCGLSSLEGGPQEVLGNFAISYNPLKNLIGCTTHITGQLDISEIEFESLEGLPPNLSVMITWFHSMPMLRLLTCKWIELGWHQKSLPRDSDPIRCLSILRKYRQFGQQAMFDCQKDLIEAGFPENARW